MVTSGRADAQKQPQTAFGGHPGSRFKAKNNTFYESWYAYPSRITRYYEQQPNRINRPVASVLFDVRSKHLEGATNRPLTSIQDHGSRLKGRSSHRSGYCVWRMQATS
jgi:hypothetical protein